MGVIGINPSSRRPAVERQKQDPFDRDLGRVLKGLQVASAGLQIMDQISPDKEQELKEGVLQQKSLNELKRGLNLDLDIKKKKFELADAPVKVKERIAKIETDIKNEKFDNVIKLQGRSQTDARYKDFTMRQNAIDNFKGLWTEYKAGNLNPVQQHAMVIAYMKAQEPNSAVLGGEFDTLSQLTRGIFAKALDAPDVAMEGLILNDKQVEYIASTMSIVDKVHTTNQNDWQNFYRSVAEKNGLDPDQIIFEQKQLPAIEGVQASIPKFSDEQIEQVMRRPTAEDQVPPTRAEAIFILNKVWTKHNTERSPEPQAPQPSPSFDVGVRP